MGKGKNRHQVFISFRGKDVKRKLLPHLKYHLKHRNVNVFTDDDAIGEPAENLFRHIRKSRIVIVIFSINYLESAWCLNELVEIKKCLETEKLDFAIPIFYKVKTSHVKKQSGKFGKKFLALQKKHSSYRIDRWKKALRFIATSVGLTYRKRSSISKLDFIKKIVKKVDITLTKIASKEDNNNSPETSKGKASNPNAFDFNHLNELLDLSKALVALNLERSYLQGFMSGFALKDGISSMHSSNSFRISTPANSLQIHRNLQRFDVQGNESLDEAIDWLALHMISEQTLPPLIFSSWDELDDYTKNNIIFSARKKSQLLKAYDRPGRRSTTK